MPAGLLVAGLLAWVPPAAWAQALPGRERQREAAAPQQRSESAGRLKRIGLSLLLPGLGHLEAGHRQRALPYFAAEAGMWTAFGIFRVQGDWRKDSYIEMAAQHAGVREAEGQPDSYYRLIGVWPSSDLYNDEVIRREARALYPDDLAGREAYVEAHRISPGLAWQWESQTAWDRYQDKRGDSRSAYKRARNMLGLAVANRVVAMIDAALLADPRRPAQSWQLEVVPRETLGAGAVQLSWRLP